MTSETFFNVSQAEKETGKSAPTIRKYLKDGRLPNAIVSLKGKARTVSIPLSDLIAAGLIKQTPTPEAPSSEAFAIGQRLGRLEAENEQLRIRIQELRDERDTLKASLAHSQGLWLRELETKEVQAKRRRFWQRLETKPQQPSAGPQ